MFAGTDIQVDEVVRAIDAGLELQALCEMFPRLTVADLAAANVYRGGDR